MTTLHPPLPHLTATINSGRRTNSKRKQRRRKKKQRKKPANPKPKRRQRKRKKTPQPRPAPNPKTTQATPTQTNKSKLTTLSPISSILRQDTCRDSRISAPTTLRYSRLPQKSKSTSMRISHSRKILLLTIMGRNTTISSWKICSTSRKIPVLSISSYPGSLKTPLLPHNAPKMRRRSKRRAQANI